MSSAREKRKAKYGVGGKRGGRGGGRGGKYNKRTKVEPNAAAATGAAADDKHGSDDDGDDSKINTATAAAAAGGGDAKKPAAAAKPGGGPIDPAKGMTAVMITCDAGKERNAGREMLNWLNESAEKLYPRAAAAAAASSKSAAAADSISSALDDELKELQRDQKSDGKDSASAERFRILNDLTQRGVSVIRVCDPAIDIVALCSFMCRELLTTKVSQTRFTVHIHPFTTTSYSANDDIIKAALPVVHAAFTKLAALPIPKPILPAAAASTTAAPTAAATAATATKPNSAAAGAATTIPVKGAVAAAAAAATTTAPASGAATPAPAVKSAAQLAAIAAKAESVARRPDRRYSIVLRKRLGNEKIDRSKLVNSIAAAVPFGHDFTVDLNDPQIAISLQVLGRVTGIAVIPDYGALREYNIRSLLDIPAPQQNSGPKKPKPDSTTQSTKSTDPSPAAAGSSVAPAAAK